MPDKKRPKDADNKKDAKKLKTQASLLKYMDSSSFNSHNCAQFASLRLLNFIVPSYIIIPSNIRNKKKEEHKYMIFTLPILGGRVQLRPCTLYQIPLQK